MKHTFDYMFAFKTMRIVIWKTIISIIQLLKQHSFLGDLKLIEANVQKFVV